MIEPTYTRLTATLSALQCVAAHLREVERLLVTPGHASDDQAGAEVRDALGSVTLECQNVLSRLSFEVWEELPEWIKNLVAAATKLK